MPDLVHVLVNDPAHKLRAGYIFRESRELQVALLRGVTALPVDSDLIPPDAHAALDGFYIREWGAGFLASKGAGERCCPMVLRVLPQRNYLHWVARVEPLPHLQATGRVRLTGDSSQTGYLSSGLSHERMPDMVETVPIDKAGGWTIRGVSGINVVETGLLAMHLHAVMRNARIVWTGVSLTSFKVA